MSQVIDALPAPEAEKVPEPGRLELIAHVEPSAEAKTFYDRSAFTLVKADDPVARVTGDLPLSPPLQLGDNVAMAPDGRTVVATAPGRFAHKGHRVWVETVLEIADNVDFATGNVDFAGDVHVRHNVADLFRVKGRSIRIGGAVEAAEIHAAEDLQVIGGIAGKDKAVCSAGHDLHAKFASSARLEAGNDIIIEKELLHARVICRGRLEVHHGSIVGGQVTANGGVRCASLGAPAGTPTLVEAGIDESLRQRSSAELPQIEAKRARAKKIRESVEPLMRNQKALNAQQKEKATELLYEAQEAEDETSTLMETLRREHDLAAARACAEVEVLKTLFPGVTVRFVGVEATIAEPLRGPVTIGVKVLRNEKKVVATDDRGGQMVLETHLRKDDPVEMLAKLLAHTGSGGASTEAA